MISDAALLGQYAENGSEPAFAEFVRRHLSLVYFGALRRTAGDSHLALEVTQDVFIAAAKRAAALSRHPAIPGWLFTSTRNAASNAAAAARRRRNRQQEALTMQELTAPGGEPADSVATDALLDQAMDSLNDRERAAVLLRFFESRPFAEIGAALSLSEEAARKRVDRALDKMRAFLARRGIESTAAAVTAGLANQAALGAPAGVYSAVTAAAFSGAAGGAGVSALAISLIMNKIKIGAVGAIIAAGAVTALVEIRTHLQLAAEYRQLQLDNRRPTPTAGGMRAGKLPEVAELTRLQRRLAVLKARPEGVVDSELKRASDWRDVGRATPEAAWETLGQACYSRDLGKAAQFIVFSDDSPENRTRFMAQFSAAVRDKFGTPERLVAAALFDLDPDPAISPAYAADNAYQFLGVQTDHLGDGRVGQVRVNVWYSNASGQESAGGSRLQSTADGWALGAMSLAPAAKPSENAVTIIQARIDPITGALRPAAR